MKNIFRIFLTDIKNLLKNPLAFIIVIGLCILPSLYAWFNIYANWDPYGNTGNIKVAVVSEDKSYTLEDGETVNMGDKVLNQLSENTSVGWVFCETAEDALDGIYDGSYYAAVVITEDFTYRMYHVFDEAFESPSILYYENEKKNAIATKITDTAAATLKRSINQSFIEVVVSTVFEESNILSGELSESEKIELLQTKLGELGDNLRVYSSMLETFVQSNDRLEASIDAANRTIPDLTLKIDKTESDLAASSQRLGETQAVLGDFSSNVQISMSEINSSLNRIQTDIDETALPNDAGAVVDFLIRATADTKKLEQQISDLAAAFAAQQQMPDLPEDVDQNLQTVLATLEILRKGAANIDGQLSTAGSALSVSAGDAVEYQVRNALDSVNDMMASCSESLAGLQDVYVNSLVPQVNTALNSMSQMLKSVTDILSNLSKTMGNMGTIFEGIENAVKGTNSSLSQIKAVVDNMLLRIDELDRKLGSAAEDETMDALITFLGGDPESYGKFFSEPVKVETVAVYPVPNYGTAMTPFYTTLAMWVGATILVSLIKVHASPKGLKDVKSYELFFGRYLLFWLAGQLQAFIIALGDIYLLKVQVLDVEMFLLAASLASFTFTMFIYALTVSFGDVGKAICMIIMVLQIAGSGGTFPIELLPEVYQKIYIFFPFPYAIKALRETMAGMYGTDYMAALGQLLIFAAVGLFVGLVLRLPFVKLNHFVEERMEDTKLM